MKTPQLPSTKAWPVPARRMFADRLLIEMRQNENIWFLVGDVGYKIFDDIRSEFPKRCFNVGAAEQAMLDIAIGLALNGKVPVLYSMTPFLLYRPFESLRNYLNHEQIGVKLLGSGRDRDYLHDGISHWCEEAREVMALFPNIKSHWPNNAKQLDKIMSTFFKPGPPTYLNLCR